MTWDTMTEAERRAFMQTHTIPEVEEFAGCTRKHVYRLEDLYGAYCKRYCQWHKTWHPAAEFVMSNAGKNRKFEGTCKAGKIELRLDVGGMEGDIPATPGARLGCYWMQPHAEST